MQIKKLIVDLACAWFVLGVSVVRSAAPGLVLGVPGKKDIVVRDSQKMSDEDMYDAAAHFVRTLSQDPARPRENDEEDEHVLLVPREQVIAHYRRFCKASAQRIEGPSAALPDVSPSLLVPDTLLSSLSSE